MSYRVTPPPQSHPPEKQISRLVVDINKQLTDLVTELRQKDARIAQLESQVKKLQGK